MPRETLQSNPCIDLVALGEAEETLPQILDYYVKGREWDSAIAGIAYRRRGEIIVTPLRSPPTELDSMPFPDPMRFTLDAPKYEELRLMGSRGCPFACKFCSVAALSQRSLRVRKADNIVSEIEWKVRTYRVSKFVFSDNLFVTDGRRERAICSEILSRSLDIQWACNCRADLGDPALFELMYRAGCRSVFVGIESGNDTVLRTSNKRLHYQRVQDCLKQIKKARIAVNAGFVLGLPGETPSTLEQTIEFARQLSCDAYTFTFYCPLPGTAFYRERQRTNRHNDEVFTVLRPLETEGPGRTELINAYLTAISDLKVHMASRS